MATLYFKVQADYDKVIRLREEIDNLKEALNSVDTSKSMNGFNGLNAKLQKTSNVYDKLIGKAAEAGNNIESSFIRKINEASNSVNSFAEKIIAQKNVVKDVEADVKKLGEAYRNSVKGGMFGGSDSALAEYKAAKKALDEEKSALFGLTQQQSAARLSVSKLRNEYSLMKGESESSADSIGKMSDKFKAMTAMVAGGVGMKELISHIVQVRGEFENIETNIGVLLNGNKEKLKDVMGQLKEYALISPLTTKDMSNALQMMMGFGIQAEDSIKYLKAMGDISMGNTEHFNSLALAFSQMSSAGKLMGQDLNQMINAGFNPLSIIAEKTGKSIGELKNEMSNGAITSKMVQQAFIDATSAGGKFYGMASAGAKTLNGQISMFQESLDNMFNDIGTKSEGFINGTVEFVTNVVSNYQKYAGVLEYLISIYGVYKVALMANIALEKIQALNRLASIQGTTTLGLATDILAGKMTVLNTIMSFNPYVAMIAGIAALGVTIYALSDKTTAEEKAQLSLNETLDRARKSQDDYNSKTQNAISVAGDDAQATKERKDAINLLISRYPSIIKKYIDEEGHLRNILQLKRRTSKSVWICYA